MNAARYILLGTLLLGCAHAARGQEMRADTMSILYTDNPLKGDWHAVPSILNDLQDPALFIDDDGQAYVFWGSSNVCTT